MSRCCCKRAKVHSRQQGSLFLVLVLSMSGCWPVRVACPHSAYLCVQAWACPDCIRSLLAQVSCMLPLHMQVHLRCLQQE